MGNFLGNLLGSAGGKDNVYLSVTPGVGLELCLVDAQTRQVKAYAVRELAYNETTREIADYEVFKSRVEDMFAELKINPKCNVVVNMPLCSLGIMNFPLISGDDAITMGVTSEVEQSYIFRRLEPIVAWSDIRVNASANSETRKILYSAIQKNVIENIGAALAAIGATLAGVEVSVISYLRALDYIGYTTSQMQDNVTWNLMIVSSTGYSLVSMVGKHIVDFYEEPLAIKTFEGDDIYNAINASAQITLMSYPANYLYIISETDMVSAELLSKKIQNAGTIDFFENNSFKKQEVMPVSLEVLPDNVLKISLQAAGCAVTNISNYPVCFNFLKDTVAASASDAPVPIQIGEQTFEITPSAATKGAAAILAVVFVIFGGLSFLILPKIEEQKNAQLSEVRDKVAAIDEQLKAVEGEQNATGSFDISKQVDFVLKNNRAKFLNYAAVGASIPDNVWITYFMTSDNGLVDVKGSSTNVEDIYVFFNNMKDSLINTKLRLHKLQMQSGTVDDLLSNDDMSSYEFEITNMDASQLNAMLGIPQGEGAQGAEGGSQNNNNNAPDNKLLSDAPVQVQ